MKEYARKSVLNVKPYIPGKPIEEVKRELGLKKVCKLASNENPFGPSPKVLAAMRKELAGLNRYPDGSCFYLRREIARRLNVNENQLVFGNGSDEIIVMAIRAFAGDGDEVIVAHPTFLIYDIAARINGAKVCKVPLKDFRYDLEAMAKAINPRTKIIFIANPDNPTGTYVTRPEVEKLVSQVPASVLVFLDEAYYEFAPKKNYPDSLSLIERYPNVIFTRTFSKFYALAGLRVGYGVAAPSLIEILDRVREPFNVNSVAQTGALAAFKDKSYYQGMLRLNESEKKRLYQNLKKIGVSYVPSVTNFVLIDVKQNSRLFFQKLLQKGVVVRDMGGWGLDTFIRVTIGKARENDRLIKSLKELL